MELRITGNMGFNCGGQVTAVYKGPDRDYITAVYKGPDGDYITTVYKVADRDYITAVYKGPDRRERSALNVLR